MSAGLLRLLPLPLGLAGGMLGGLLWWLLWLLNPSLWNELDEVEGYVIFCAIFLGWGLINGCLFMLVPPFRATTAIRDAVRYRARRAVWLFALPMVATWGAAITIAVFLAQPGLGWQWEPVLAAVIFAMTLMGTAWVAQECCDWLQPKLPREIGAAAAWGAIVISALSLGTIAIVCTPYLWELMMPQGNITAMAAAEDFLETDMEVYSIMMIGPAVHGTVLATLVPICEAVWRIPPPRRRDLGSPPWFLLALPAIAAFDLLAVTIYIITG